MRVFLAAALVLLAVPSALAAPDAVRPRVSLQVTFVQPEFQTTYAIRGAARATNVVWSFTKPPREPNCTQFSSAGKSATWLHGDQHGCDHQQMTAVGHEGTIAVRFKLRGYTCRIAHRGSETSTAAGRCRK